MASQDEVMNRIVEAATLHRGGNGDGARLRLAEIWEEISPDGDALHRCTLSHYMADLQDDLRDELIWDQRALHAAESLTDERAQQHHASLSVRGFYPSLHLNLAEVYRKHGEFTQAREHLAQAKSTMDALDDDAYGEGVREAIARLTTQLSSTAPT